MVSFRESSVTDDAARAQLADYFRSRALSFPSSMGRYRTPTPEASHFEPPRGVFLVVEGEDLAGDAADVGCGGIRLLAHSAGVTRFEVKHLWVQPSAQGTGIGTLLLAELESRARAFGASELVLDTNAAQESATRLYRRAGFTEIAPYNDNSNATHWFAKNLTTELE